MPLGFAATPLAEKGLQASFLRASQTLKLLLGSAKVRQAFCTEYGQTKIPMSKERVCEVFFSALEGREQGLKSRRDSKWTPDTQTESSGSASVCVRRFLRQHREAPVKVRTQRLIGTTKRYATHHTNTPFVVLASWLVDFRLHRPKL